MKPKKGLAFARRFSKKGTSVYDLFEYELRSSVIKNPDGEVLHKIEPVEVPKGWSQTATDVFAQKYLRRTDVPQPDGTNGSEFSIRQVVHRMVNCWKWWGETHHYFASEKDAEIFYDELAYMLLAQYAAPNSPQWFNTGLYSSYGIKGNSQGHYYVDPKSGKLTASRNAFEHPQPHACFILSVSDDLVNEGGIMDLYMREARIFKYGSGVGTNFSRLRGAGEKLSGGGYSSGLMSFLKIGDCSAGAIKSGGTTRRAAKMVCLDLDHPEVEEFINWKVNEEKKAVALIEAGYSSHYEGEAYGSVGGQNSNNSIRIPNAFFKVLEKDQPWNLISRSTGEATKSVSSKKLWDEIAYAAWRCADPGLQFDTTINEWHTCPEGGRINASNPCSEYMFLDNTACNLASLNLRKFYDENELSFDVASFRHACRLWTIVLEISVLMAQFPSKEVAQLSYEYRTLGLGYANLGSLFMISGIPYDSEKARSVAAAITALMTGTAYSTSAEMAGHFGPFARYQENRKHMMRVIRNHRYAAYNAKDAYEGLEIKPGGIDSRYCPDYLLEAACKAWDEALSLGQRNGFRNAQTTVIAPTGTIGLVMDCDTTGVEPDFALIKLKKLSGGGYFKIVNESVPLALKNLGYNKEEVNDIMDYLRGKATFKGAPIINYETLLAKGFQPEELKKLDEGSAALLSIDSLFSKHYLGTECLKRLGFDEKQFSKPDFNLLSQIGFTKNQIEEANNYVCGMMTIEGAPQLLEEHLAVFDCANKCGKYGNRYILPMGHIYMMASVQPFISGAISKTINLPYETTEEEMKNCFDVSWKAGLKAISVYRDGCKMSQPLSSGAKTGKSISEMAGVDPGTLTENDVLEAARRIIQHSVDTSFKRQLSNIVHRKRLPVKRGGFTQKAKIGGHTIFVRTGEYGDGTLGEIFIDMHKEGASFRSLMNCFAIAVSIGLQYGVPLEEFVEKFIFTRFDPSGPVDHPNIKSATSVTDYVFRLLALEYLHRDDLVQVKPQEIERKNPELKAGASPGKTEKTEDRVQEENQQFIGAMMGDAPLCDQCGHITIRSGACYKCLNCGTSLGCS